MKYLYSFILLIFIASLVFINQNKSHQFSEKKEPLLELSLKGIQDYTQYSVWEIKNFFQYPLFLPSANHKALEKLHETGLHLASRLAILKHIDTLTDDPALIRQGKYGFWKIVRVSLLKNWKEKINILLEQLDQNSSLKPHQQFILKKLHDSSISKKQKENIKKILTTMDHEVTPYTYLKGTNREKKSDHFSLLSFNVCFTPKDMPLVFGGLDKWEDRIDSVVTLIKESDADILCLQEIFDTKAHESLYEKLKDHYSHFYINIGPWGFEGSFSSLGFESGLFVASKYPIVNPKFIPFEKDNPHIHRGFFTFQAQSESGNSLRVFTTHLEPFDEGKGLRKKELEQILKQIHAGQTSQIPTILCGDLNMDPDESKSWIDRHFIDSFQGKEPTHCDFSLHRWDHPQKGPLKPNQLDYTLLLKTDTHKIKTSLIKAFDIDNPKDAISDHHAMYTEVQV